MMKPAMPAFRPWSSACLPSVAETCERETSVSFSGSAPILRIFARSCADWIGEAAGDLRAGRAVDAVRVLAPVDVRRRDELVVERDREVLRGLQRVAAERVVGAALGHPARDRLERLAALAREVERHDRLVAELWSKFCSGFLMSVPRQARAVLDDPPAVRIGDRRRSGLLLAQDEHAGRDLDDLARRLLLGGRQRVQRLLARVERLAVAERLLGVLVEDVEARLGRGLGRAAGESLASGSEPLPMPTSVHLDACVHRRAQADDRLALVGVDVRVGLALLVEDVRFPVVEEQLGGRADLLRPRAGRP